MLGWRLGISAVLIPALVGLFIADHRLGANAPILLGLCLLLVVRGAWEITLLLSTRQMAPSFARVAIGASVVLCAAWVGVWRQPASPLLISLTTIAVAFSICVLSMFIAAALRYREPGGNMETLGAEILSVAYIGLLLAVTAQLRWIAGADAGYLVLASVVISAKCGDVGAYFLGRFLGRRKMIPRLSPGKTWMGFVGAVLGSGLGGWAWLTFATPRFGDNWQPAAWYWLVLYGVVLGLAGLVGDLCESLIKRDVEAKDSAALLPGFGGLLDLLDSVLFAGPVAVILWYTLPLATWQ